MQLLADIPALPVRNVEQSILFFRDILELSTPHLDTGFAIFYRDGVEVHIWQADDESWRTRSNGEPGLSRSFLERPAAEMQFSE